MLFSFNLSAGFQLCQTAVQNSNSKRRENITLEPGSRMEACYSELILPEIWRTCQTNIFMQNDQDRHFSQSTWQYHSLIQLNTQFQILKFVLTCYMTQRQITDNLFLTFILQLVGLCSDGCSVGQIIMGQHSGLWWASSSRSVHQVATLVNANLFQSLVQSFVRFIFALFIKLVSQELIHLAAILHVYAGV